MSIPNDPTRPQSPGPHFCAAIANSMLGHFVTRLGVEARKNGGSLTPEQIEAAAARFIADSGRFGGVLKRSWDECGAARDAAAWDSSRRRPFDRMIVKRFAHLLPARSGDDGGVEPCLSRRVIPGVHVALDKMLGPQLFEQCQRKAHGIVDRWRGPAGALDWNRVHSDADARALVNDVLVVMAHYFVNFAKRRDWFIGVVNANLARVAADAPDRAWQLTPVLFHRLMLALYAELFASLHDNAGAALRHRYGDGAAETLSEFFSKINGLA